MSSLRAIPCTVRLKMKFHNAKEEVVTLCADLMGARRYHKPVQRNLDVATILKNETSMGQAPRPANQ